MREVRYCEVAHFHFISLNPFPIYLLLDPTTKKA